MTEFVICSGNHVNPTYVRLYTWHIYYLVCKKPDEEVMFSFF